MRYTMGSLQRFLFTVAIVGAMTLATAARGVLAEGGTGPGVGTHVRGSVEETLDALKKMVGDSGMMVMGELHQGKVLAMTGLSLESETIFVGNPKVGKDVFSEDPGAGIALPIRVNVYKNVDGQTIVRYVPPSHLLRDFHNPKIRMVAKMLDEKLEKMIAMLPQ